MDESKELRKYMLPGVASGLWLVVILGILGVALIAGACADRYDEDFYLMLGLGIVFLVMDLLIVLGWVKNRRALDRTLDELQGQDKLDDLIKEFAEAKPVLKDGMRLGEEHIFPKRNGYFIAYGDVTRVFQYVHRTNFVEDNRMLKVRLTTGKERAICRLRRRGKSDEELQPVLAFMLQKNPAIQIGYDK